MEALRFEGYRSIVDYLGPKVATHIEAWCYVNSCKSGTVHGVPTWHYANGAVLFETDRPEAHLREFASSYLDHINRVQHVAPFAPTLQNVIDLLLDDSKAAEHVPYGPWLEAHLNDLKKSKAVLEERAPEPEHDFIKCRRCKSGAIDTEQKQTRSADEPMTIFCLCRKCGARFTMS